MSFFNAIKRSLGFGEDIDDGLLNDSNDTGAYPHTPALPSSDSQNADTLQIEFDPAMTDAIFSHVVDTFNNALPDFLGKAVDPEAQRKQLYDTLDSSIKKYLDDITHQTRRACETRWSDEQTSMRGEMENLKAKAKEIEQQRFEIKQQQLSADRQRRALSDKVHDLENQLSSFQAEREQLDLENKSLINKLKVASVHESEAESLRNDLNDARAELQALRSSAGENIPTKFDDETVTRLEQEIESLNKQLDEAAEKDRISTEMFNSLQSRASAARSELESKDKEIDELKVKLAEAENNRHDIEQLSMQMTMIEEAIEKRDRKISKLKETCENLKAENESLRDTIAANLKSHADAESRLKDRIAELESDPTTPIATSDITGTDAIMEESSITPNDTPKISDNDLAEIEESFDSSDWMTTEPTETPSMRAGINEAEFGYQAPVRKTPRQDNDAQLSLF